MGKNTEIAKDVIIVAEKKPMNSEPSSGTKRRLTVESKTALVFGIISLILSILALLFLYINWDIPPGEIKGSHPWVATLGQYLHIGGSYGCLASFLISLIALVTGFFNKPRLLNVAVGCLSLIIAYTALCVSFESLGRIRKAQREISCHNLRHLGYTLKKYSEEHNGQLPPTIT